MLLSHIPPPLVHLDAGDTQSLRKVGKVFTLPVRIFLKLLFQNLELDIRHTFPYLPVLFFLIGLRIFRIIVLPHLILGCKLIHIIRIKDCTIGWSYSGRTCGGLGVGMTKQRVTGLVKWLVILLTCYFLLKLLVVELFILSIITQMVFSINHVFHRTFWQGFWREKLIIVKVLPLNLLRIQRNSLLCDSVLR